MSHWEFVLLVAGLIFNLGVSCYWAWVAGKWKGKAKALEWFTEELQARLRDRDWIIEGQMETIDDFRRRDTPEED